MSTGAGVVLDDLTFEDLLRIALVDVPGSSRGRWTLHGPVDPGVTVLELYCWLFEQRLFMADRTVEPVVRAALRLLGIADPHPSTAATIVLCFRPPVPPAPVTLPAGTVMSLDRDPAGRRFALAAPVTVLPVTAVGMKGSLARAGDALDLVLTPAALPPTGAPLSLLVDLAAAPGVPPGWQPAAPDVPPPADLTWTAIGPSGVRARATVTDGTGGLRRPGLVGVAWPAVWDRPGECRLRIEAVAGGWTEAVRIRGVTPNAAPAVHRVPRTAAVDAQLTGFLPLPGQRLRLPEPPETVADDPGAARLRLVEADGAAHDWTSVPSWVGVGPGDRVMLLDRTRGELVFGDGRVGRIPRPATGPAAEPAATVTYAVGGGVAGNLGAGRTWVEDGGAAVADGPLPADGGAEAESLDDVRLRAVDELGVPTRTVHVADTQALAEATPGAGIARARALPARHPDFPCSTVPAAITVVVVPHADRSGPSERWTAAPVPDRGALAAVRAHLARGRLLGQELFVLPPTYRAVGVRVTVAQTAGGAAVRAEIVDALRRFLDPLEGGDGGDGWPFGGVVRPSRLTAALQETLGPRTRVSTVSVALDGAAETACADLAIGPGELVRLDAVRVDVDVTLPVGTGLS